MYYKIIKYIYLVFNYGMLYVTICGRDPLNIIDLTISICIMSKIIKLTLEQTVTCINQQYDMGKRYLPTARNKLCMKHVETRATGRIEETNATRICGESEYTKYCMRIQV